MSPNLFSMVTAYPPSLDLRRRIAQERVPTMRATPDRAGARPYHRSDAGSRGAHLPRHTPGDDQVTTLLIHHPH
jgi:hypothetical protein